MRRTDGLLAQAAALALIAAGCGTSGEAGVPSTAVIPLAELGVQFTSSSAWSGAAYVDSIGW